ncbi:MAG: hydroxymethylbilane synthase [Methanocellales archaeon]
MQIKIGTRGSKLALAQANRVCKLLEHRGIETMVRVIKTTGDTFKDRLLHELAASKGAGAFVREIDEKLLRGEIDLAVHSLKDIPTERPKGLTIAAVLKRDSPYDVLITRDGSQLESLPLGAIVGTSSLRRKAQLLRYRGDLQIKPLRGNLDTRLRKLREGYYDAIFAAEAGLQRLELNVKYQRLSIEYFTPSANQGTIAIVAREGSKAEEIARALDHQKTRIETEIERIILRALGGGCIVPVGVLAIAAEDGVMVKAEAIAPDGSSSISIVEEIPLENYREQAMRIGQVLRDKGGGELIKKAADELRKSRS